MIKGRVHSVESCGTVDGPGIRFVVFLQGCPLRCAYCHNPDTWAFDGGTEMTVAEIMERYEGCKEFLRNGGLTVTGGEPLAQIEFVTELFKACKERGVHTCIDTSGFYYSHTKNLEYDKLLAVTDLVMLDIKHIKEEGHLDLTKVSGKPTLAFAKRLSDLKIPVWIRHVIVPGVTLFDELLFEIGYFCGGISSLKAIDVLPYHKMGEEKYKELGIKSPLADTVEATKDQAENARKIIMSGIMQKLKEEKNNQLRHN